MCAHNSPYLTGGKSGRAEESNGAARSTINHIFGYVVIFIALRRNGFSLCYSQKAAKTD